jgi:hypothetical protein
LATFTPNKTIPGPLSHIDHKPRRRLNTFARKKDADAHHAKVAVDLQDGIHTADRASPTVKEAGHLWLQTGEQTGARRRITTGSIWSFTSPRYWARCDCRN